MTQRTPEVCGMLDAPFIAIGAALSEAVADKKITEEFMVEFINRAEVFYRALVEGKVVRPHDDGHFTIEEASDELLTLLNDMGLKPGLQAVVETVEDTVLEIGGKKNEG